MHCKSVGKHSRAFGLFRVYAGIIRIKSIASSGLPQVDIFCFIPYNKRGGKISLHS